VNGYQKIDSEFIEFLGGSLTLGYINKEQVTIYRAENPMRAMPNREFHWRPLAA